MKIARRVWTDIKHGENIDIYVTVAVSCCVVVLGLIGIAPQTVILPIVLAVLAFLSADSLRNRFASENLYRKIQAVENNGAKLLLLLGEMTSRIGTPPEIIFEPARSRTGKFLRKLTEYINQTVPGDEIYVLARYSRPYGRYYDDDSYEKVRREYSESLLAKAREPGIVYRRIICFDDDKGELTTEYVGQWLVDHVKEMLRIAEGKPGKISLKRGRVVIGPELFIIRGKIGVIAIDVRDAETSLPHTTGGVIFHNPPNGELIEQLTNFFMMADNQSVPVERMPEQE
jgi:hypothetical protein